ncbi:hypothetical protein CR513_53897, partial [Mucuna pruriens]
IDCTPSQPTLLNWWWTPSTEPRTLIHPYRPSISGGSDALSCKLFPGTLTVCNEQSKKVGSCKSFYIKQRKGKNLKGYLTRFNMATVRKGLRIGQFSGSLVLRILSSMEEIRARVEKHIETKEDLIDRIEAKRSVLRYLGKCVTPTFWNSNFPRLDNWDLAVMSCTNSIVRTTIP